MVGKRVKFDDETWEAIQAVMRGSGSDFQELANEPFTDFLRKAQAAGRLKALLKRGGGRDSAA